MEAVNGVGAAARVQRDQNVAIAAVIFLPDGNAVTERPQHTSPAQRGNLVAVVYAQRRRGDELNSHEVNLFCAGAEAGPDIAPVRGIKISPGIANKQRRGCPAAAPQHFMGSKPWLRVFLIGIDGKTRIRQKIIGSPFPHITDHLAAAEGAIA